MGLLLQGFPLNHDWYLFRGPCLLGGSLHPSHHPRVTAWMHGRLHGLVPVLSPYAPARSGTNPVPLPDVAPFLEFLSSSEHAPVCTGSRFDRGASPHALRQGDVPVYRGPRVSRITRGTDPSRDL